MWKHHRRTVTEKLRLKGPLQFPSPKLLQAGLGHSYIRLLSSLSSPSLKLSKDRVYTVSLALISMLYHSYCEDFFSLCLIRMSYVETWSLHLAFAVHERSTKKSSSGHQRSTEEESGTWETFSFITIVHLQDTCRWISRVKHHTNTMSLLCTCSYPYIVFNYTITHIFIFIFCTRPSILFSFQAWWLQSLSKDCIMKWVAVFNICWRTWKGYSEFYIRHPKLEANLDFQLSRCCFWVCKERIVILTFLKKKKVLVRQGF